VFREEGGSLVGSSGTVEIAFDGDTGAIHRLRNLATGQTLVDARTSVPWRMPRQAGTFYIPPHAGFVVPEYVPAGFSFALDDGREQADLAWRTDDPGVRVRVAARFSDDALELWPHVEVDAGSSPPARLEYPLLPAPNPLAENGEDDYLVFPGQSGWLIRSPLTAPPARRQGAAPVAGVAEPAREPEGFEAVYPDGYHGCSVQFMAYFGAGSGGFYLACHDPHSTCKSFGFSAAEVAFGHESWDLRLGAQLDLDYPVVIAPLIRGDWYEAAERYRSWALTAPWSRGGVPNVHNPALDGARWLFEEVGVSLWGTPSSLDWTPWYEYYAEALGAPLHICAGWDWPASRPHTVGREGWFPARFHAENLKAWKRHRVTPYMNDLFISARAEAFDEAWEPNLLFPYVHFDWTRFAQPRDGWLDGSAPGPDPVITTTLDFVVCPATSAQSELHAWRDTELVRAGLDGVFYDISSGNPHRLARCLRAEHGHPPGRGRSIIEAYDSVNRASKEAVARETGRYLVQGVETIIENVGGSVDFYVSRACAGPLGVLEGWTLGPEAPPGAGRELIPLYQAVYHDVGPVHEDGWLTLSADTGDLFFWVAARIYLQWGGLLSLHYAGSPPERPPGYDGPAEVIAFDGALVRFDELPAADPHKIDFVRELARARTTYGRPFLAYGTLIRPVPLDVGRLELRYRREIHGFGTYAEGVWPAPEVIHSAWRDVDGNLGLFFVNLRETEPITVTVSAAADALWGMSLAGRVASLVTSDGTASLGAAPEDRSLAFSVPLAPRRVALLRIGS
jgi:hypothetical protein